MRKTLLIHCQSLSIIRLFNNLEAYDKDFMLISFYSYDRKNRNFE